jgi:tetratricopeptide (TPR) repeat protein
MLSGQTAESIAWCDRVLAHPEVAAPDVILESLVTKGTALSNAGRDVEAEALLRGCVAIADAAGNLAAGLRARNNLRVVMQWSNLELALVLCREVRDMARKYGVRAWVLHGIASSQDVTFRLGTFEPLSDEEQAEIVDGGDFYSAWFELEHSRRQVYRGDPVEAERQFERGLVLPAMANSAQATTWNLAAKADALIAQGRFDEAFDLALKGQATSAENELAMLAAQFSAAGAGDAARIARVRDDYVAAGMERLPAGRGYIAAAESLIAALEGRWDDARARLLDAVALLEAVGEGLALARFRLAFGHIAGDHVPEGRDAAMKADAFFAEIGASGYTDAYRARAARAAGPAERAGATDGRAVEPGATVRAAG